MKASELIVELQNKMDAAGKDFVVLAQSGGCCRHGHPIRSVDISVEQSDDHEFEGKQPCIVIRV